MHTESQDKLLNETEEFLRFGTWTWDVITDKVEWSKGLLTLLAYSENELPSKINNDTFLQHISEQNSKEIQLAIQQAVTDKIGFQKTFTVITNDNKEKIVSTRGRVVTSLSGNVIKIIGVTHDITEQAILKKEQQELKGNLARCKESTMEKERMLNFGSFEMDIKNKALEWSDGMFLLFGYDPQTDRGKVTIDDDFYNLHMTESEVSVVKDQFNDALDKLDNYFIETSIRTKSGIAKQLETYGKIERDSNGTPYKIVGITKDITRLKDYEKILQQKIEELDRSNKELEEFAYIASHDLQEPLRKITAFSERLEEKAYNEIGQEGQLYLKRILASTQNMRSLIDNLLEFSRTSRPTDSLEKIDLNMILKEVLTDLELKMEETNAVIEGSPMPTITSYPSQMKQLFTNLLSNAIKFRNPAETPIIKISVENLSDKEKNVHSLFRDTRYYKITIKDSGIGFDQEYSSKIFQIFQRLHGKAEYPGSGIGLAICKKIVDNHNGIIYAESVPGNGAAFIIVLPENQ